MASNENDPRGLSISSSSLSSLMNPVPKQISPTHPTKDTQPFRARQPLSSAPPNASSAIHSITLSPHPRTITSSTAKSGFTLSLGLAPISAVESRRVTPNIGSGSNRPAPRREYSRHYGDPFVNHGATPARPFLPFVDKSSPPNSQGNLQYRNSPTESVIHHPLRADLVAQTPTKTFTTPMPRRLGQASSSTRPASFARNTSDVSHRAYRGHSPSPSSSSHPTPCVLQSKTKRQLEEEEKDTTNVYVHVPGQDKAYCLHGVQRPKIFKGDNEYPHHFVRQDPIPQTPKPEKKGSKASTSTLQSGGGSRGASSLNAWDYVEALVAYPKDGIPDEGDEDDYEMDDEQNDVRASNKKADKPKNARRQFCGSELWAVHLLWKITQNPMKGQRQRLGFWLGVPTKHIAVWFQNRRQEEKKNADKLAKAARLAGMSIEEFVEAEASTSTQTPAPSQRRRAAPGSSARRIQNLPETSFRKFGEPTDEQKATMTAIASGDLTRDAYFQNYPLQKDERTFKRVRSGLGISGSGLLDQYMEDRDVDRGDRPRHTRRTTGEPIIYAGDDYHDKLLALCSSDGPEPEESVRSDDDDGSTDKDTSKDEAEDWETVCSESQSQRSVVTEPSRSRAIGRGLPSTHSSHVGRATSQTLMSHTLRARELFVNCPRSVSGPLLPVSEPCDALAAIPARPLHTVEGRTARLSKPAQPPTYPFDMARASHSVVSQLPHRDSFQRSQSFAVRLSDSPPSDSASLITPDNTPFGRSQSFQGRTAHDRGEGSSTSIYTSMDPPKSTSVARAALQTAGEPDEEMLEAAQQLFSISGWSASKGSGPSGTQ